MDTLPCSRVADKELHKPHTYYFGGHDVRCSGYSPAQLAESDQAETPEEFFGLDPITKAATYTESEAFRLGYDLDEEDPKDDPDEEIEISLLSFFTILTLVFLAISFVTHAIVC